MTDMAGSDEASRPGRPWGRMVAAQIVAYAVMCAALAVCWWGVLPQLGVSVIAVVILAAFVVGWPFETFGPCAGLAERVTTAVFGLVSIGIASWAGAGQGLAGPGPRNAGWGPVAPALVWFADTMVGFWAFAFIVMAVVLVVIGFIRQMARERRDHLIRFLSTSLLGGIAAISLGGWVVVARFWPAWHTASVNGSTQIGFATLPVALWSILVVLMAVALFVASCRWWAWVSHGPRTSLAWLGFGLLPMMCAGLLPFLATAGLLVIA